MNADQKMLSVIETLKHETIKPKLLLNSCCGPCSTSVLEQLVQCFDVTIHFFNPNMDSENEYQMRLNAQKIVQKYFSLPEKALLEHGWQPEEWQRSISKINFEKEGGIRCKTCIEYRMKETSLLAKKMGFEWFGTTLSVSPHKNALMINEIGASLQAETDIKFLESDFKKRNGYKRSLEISAKLELYRQSYCGCSNSKS